MQQGAVLLLLNKRGRAFIALSLAFLVPAAAVVVLQMTMFSTTLEYYRTLGNTSIPIMHLIGPPEVAQPSSIVYYFVQFGRVGLFLMTPLIAVAVLGLRGIRGRMGDPAARRQVLLWLWLLTPVVALIFMPVKEPRHIAPCIVPAVLLMMMGVRQLTTERARRLAHVGLAVLAVGSYLTVTMRLLPFPYFLDRPLELDALLAAMRRNDPAMPPSLLDEHWGHARNIAIAGFEPNEALAIAWHVRPAVVFDLDLFRQRETLDDPTPFQRYEDLFTLVAFNLYNRRCGWERYLDTVTRSEVLAHADFVLLKNTREDYAAVTYPLHERVATIDLTDGEVLIMRGRDPNSVPYRLLYGAAYANRAADLDDFERDVLFLDLYKALQSRNPRVDPSTILGLPDASGRRIFPERYQPANPSRNIYFYSFYPRLFMIYDQIARQSQSAPTQ